MTTATKTRPWLSGFCSPSNDTASHRRCLDHPRADGVPCSCDCHTEPELLEPTARIVPDLPEPEYHAHPALSQTLLRHLIPPSTPAHFRYALDHPRPDTTAYDVGHAVHTLVLGVGAGIVRIDAPDRRGKGWKDAEAAVRANGGVPLLAVDYDAAMAMAEAVVAHPVAGPVFARPGGRAEQTLLWDDADTGVPCRARLDWLTTLADSRPLPVDLKTTRNANPGSFGKAAADYGYYLQAAHYLDGAKACGIDAAAFLFVLVEKTPPYLVSTTELSVDDLALGRRLRAEALALYADCQRTDTWPGYPPEVHVSSMPGWFHAQHREDYYA